MNNHEEVNKLLLSVIRIGESAMKTYSKDISDWHDDVQTMVTEAMMALEIHNSREAKP